MQGRSAANNLQKKLEAIKSRLKNSEITLDEAKQIVEEAEGVSGKNLQTKFNNTKVEDLYSDSSPSTVGNVITANTGNPRIDQEGSQFYMDQRGVGLGQNVESILAVQGGTNLDMLNATNRHDVNMALISPGARLLSALAYKNLIG
tara:strand:+ start:3874 stop:4311 length:438 start_codon:yes stop_codon:yes gene_type:complete